MYTLYIYYKICIFFHTIYLYVSYDFFSKQLFVSVHNIHRTIFLMEAHCVFCGVLTDYTYNIILYRPMLFFQRLMYVVVQQIQRLSLQKFLTCWQKAASKMFQKNYWLQKWRSLQTSRQLPLTNTRLGLAMARAVSRRLPPRRPWFDLPPVNVGFVVDKVALGQVFPRVLQVFPVSFIPPVLHYTEKRKKKLIIFITGLRNKPSGCGASVASAAGPFSKKHKDLFTN